MSAAKILWVDDEIDLLKPHILFLAGQGLRRGYLATTVTTRSIWRFVPAVRPDHPRRDDAGADWVSKRCPRIKELRPMTPVIMVTKSEEENIMDKAVGSKIADYLIKPVNPNQVLLSIKKERPQPAARHRADDGRLPQRVRSHRLVVRLPRGRSPTGCRSTSKLVWLGGGAVRVDRSGRARDPARTRRTRRTTSSPSSSRADYLDWFAKPRRRRAGAVAAAGPLESVPGGGRRCRRRRFF